MQEIIKRRYTRLINEKQKLPDLILVDGGLTQIKAGNEILNSINANIPLVGLFKNDKHQTKGLMDKNGNIYEINNKNLEIEKYKQSADLLKNFEKEYIHK